MEKLNKNKGFTLAELLIVVAIIAVLVAIAIPTFNSQLERSREGVDLANLRNGYAEAKIAAMTADNSTIKFFAYTMPVKRSTKGWVIDTNEFPEGKASLSGLDFESTASNTQYMIFYKLSDTFRDPSIEGIYSGKIGDTGAVTLTDAAKTVLAAADGSVMGVDGEGRKVTVVTSGETSSVEVDSLVVSGATDLTAVDADTGKTFTLTVTKDGDAVTDYSVTVSSVADNEGIAVADKTPTVTVDSGIVTVKKNNLADTTTYTVTIKVTNGSDTGTAVFKVTTAAS